MKCSTPHSMGKFFCDKLCSQFHALQSIFMLETVEIFIRQLTERDSKREVKRYHFNVSQIQDVKTKEIFHLYLELIDSLHINNDMKTIWCGGQTTYTLRPHLFQF